MLFLISGFLSVPHSDSLPFVRHFVPSKGVRYLLLHSRFTAFYASLRSFKKRSLASAAHYSRIFVRLFVPSKIVRKLASACYSLSLCVAFAPSNRFARYPGFPARIENNEQKSSISAYSSLNKYIYSYFYVLSY